MCLKGLKYLPDDGISKGLELLGGITYVVFGFLVFFSNCKTHVSSQCLALQPYLLHSIFRITDLFLKLEVAL